MVEQKVQNTEASQDPTERMVAEGVKLQRAAVVNDKGTKQKGKKDGSESKEPAAPPLLAALSSLVGNSALP